MATQDGFETKKDASTGNWTLECKGNNFDAQEKKVKVVCNNTNFTGDLVVDVKARDANAGISWDALSLNYLNCWASKSYNDNDLLINLPSIRVYPNTTRWAYIRVGTPGWISSDTSQNLGEVKLTTVANGFSFSHMSASSSGTWFDFHRDEILQCSDSSFTFYYYPGGSYGDYSINCPLGAIIAYLPSDGWCMINTAGSKTVLPNARNAKYLRVKSSGASSKTFNLYSLQISNNPTY